MHIEIITTPNEALKESGFGTLDACKSVLATVQGMGHDVTLKVCQTKNDLAEMINRKPDLVVLAVKYIPLKNGDNIWLSDYCAQHGINFTGSSREVLEFDSNKVLAKTHLINKDIKTADYFIAIPNQYKNETDLPFTFPLFLKPLDAANGNGIDDQSYVTSFAGFKSKLTSLYQTFKQPVLVEEYLNGREFTVAIIKTQNEGLMTSAVEIIPPTSGNGLRILGAQAKMDDSEILVAIDDRKLKNKVTALAVNAFHALGARDFGRIDIKTNTEDDCFFIEANLVPGLTQGSSYFPQACKIAHAFTYDNVIEQLLAGGLARAFSTIPPHIQPGSDTCLASAI